MEIKDTYHRRVDFNEIDFKDFKIVCNKCGGQAKIKTKDLNVDLLGAFQFRLDATCEKCKQKDTSYVFAES